MLTMCCWNCRRTTRTAAGQATAKPWAREWTHPIPGQRVDVAKRRYGRISHPTYPTVCASNKERKGGQAIKPREWIPPWQTPQDHTAQVTTNMNCTLTRMPVPSFERAGTIELKYTTACVDSESSRSYAFSCKVEGVLPYIAPRHRTLKRHPGTARYRRIHP